MQDCKLAKTTALLASQVSQRNTLLTCLVHVNKLAKEVQISWQEWCSHVVSADGVIMEGKTVQIKLKGNSETGRAPMQRNLFRRQEDDETLCMPNGAPAGRFWLTDIDDLVETSR